MGMCGECDAKNGGWEGRLFPPPVVSRPSEPMGSPIDTNG